MRQTWSIRHLALLLAPIHVLLAWALLLPALPFSGDRVLRLVLANDDDVAVLEAVLKNVSLSVDLWSHGFGVGTVDLRVPAKSLDFVQESFASIAYSTAIDDVGLLLERVSRTDGLGSHLSAATADPEAFFSSYQSLDSIMQFLKTFSAVKSFSIGQSYLGADIPAVQIGSGSRGFVIQAGAHAREWIAPATATYFAYWLATNSSASVLLKYFTITIIPVLNVDGYAYTRNSTGDRLWRKNRQPNANTTTCPGTDINRNFDAHWSEAGASSDPCALDYFGSSVFSTPEAISVRNLVRSLGNVVMHIDFHSYSQLWMFPNGYTCASRIADYDSSLRGSEIAVSALKAVNGATFTNGDICNTIYQTSGSATDYFYHSQNVLFSYAVELRGSPTDFYGFLLPAEQIIPSGKEAQAALFALSQYVMGVLGESATTSSVQTRSAGVSFGREEQTLSLFFVIFVLLLFFYDNEVLYFAC